MLVITSSKEMQQYALAKRAEGKSIGFVPTMGFLHEGHAGLMKKAKITADVNVVSVFVNPTQFGPNEDFETYPRDFDHDKDLAEVEGMDVLFFPSVEEIYSEEDLIQQHVTQRTDVLCGSSRPGHFDGVVTVLTKLFNLVQPNYVFFGLKDAQQVAVIEGMIQTFLLPIEVIRVETVREADGLAKSSRNGHLEGAERQEAPLIYQTLKWGRDLVLNRDISFDTIEGAVQERLEGELKLGKMDYVRLLTYPGLKPATNQDDVLILASAVFYKKARLIDNIIFNRAEE